MPRQKKLANFWQKWQVAALFVPFVKKVLKDLTHEEAQLLTNKPKKAATALREMIRDFTIKYRHEDLLEEWLCHYQGGNAYGNTMMIEYGELLAEWSLFYDKVFGTKVDFSDLVIPKKQDGFDWLVVMLKGMTLKMLIDKCKERFWIEYDCKRLSLVEYKYMVIEMKESARTAEKTYAIWTEESIEYKDEILKSADDYKNNGINAITFEECLLLELFHHFFTDHFLDIEHKTLCAGSRDINNEVPSIHYDHHHNYVDIMTYPASLVGVTRRVISNCKIGH